jgi:hypothetical protein
MSDFIKNIIDMGQKLLPIIDAAVGTTWIGAAVNAGKAVIDLIDGVKAAGDATPEEMDATRDALEQRVNAHVDQTISDLRGE